MQPVLTCLSLNVADSVSDAFDQTDTLGGTESVIKQVELQLCMASDNTTSLVGGKQHQ